MRWLGSCLAVIVGAALGGIGGGAVGMFLFMVTQGALDPLFAIGHVTLGAGIGALIGGCVGYWIAAPR